MPEGYPNGPQLNKKTIVHTEKKFMDVRRIRFQKKLSSQSYMVDILLVEMSPKNPLSFLEKVKATVTVKLA